MRLTREEDCRFIVQNGEVIAVKKHESGINFSRFVVIEGDSAAVPRCVWVTLYHNFSRCLFKFFNKNENSLRTRVL